MSINLKEVLKNKLINQWNLFWIISIPMSLLMVVAMMRTDITTPAGVSSMIGFSVRWAVPFIYLVVAASSAQILFPGPFSMWWLRNRKFIGLCFAVAMAWQGLFISIMSNFFRGYYYEEIYLLRDEIEGSVGYILLTAMVVTSFNFGRKHLSARQWKLLHKTGIYFLWAYPFSVYWWNLSYYGNPQSLDYFYYWAGFLAFAMRIAAWGKRRKQATARKLPAGNTPITYKLLGGALIAFGLVASATGVFWQEAVSAFLLAPQWSATLELWLPFWPYQPYLPLFIIGIGTLLFTRDDSETV